MPCGPITMGVKKHTTSNTITQFFYHGEKTYLGEALKIK